MAQSRPPSVRTHSVATTPPPLSPRTPNEKHSSEKKHHARRKSGKDHHIVSEKKTRPAPLSRRTTPQHVTKVGPAWSSKHGARDREREDEERGRDSGESFPQFCMSCEKQFMPANNTFLYCSEACRLHDQAPTYAARSNSYTPTSISPPQSPYTRHLSTLSTTYSPDEGPDIIPRFSPTQSRPRSYFNSEPYPASYQPPTSTTYSSSPPTTNANSRSSTALASLRELAIALPKPTPSNSSSRKNSAPEPQSTSPPTSAVWNYMPFSGSKTATPTPTSSYTAPSYTTPQGYTMSTSYGNNSAAYGGRQEELSRSYGHGLGTATGVAGYGNTGGMGMDRPLPPRSGPGGYGHRPRSIDLVTPYSGGR